MRGAALFLPLVLLSFLPSRAHAESTRPRTHIVHAGQRLGSIAKRYNVTVEAITRANGIRETDPIHPGQRLIIPSKDDEAKNAGKRKATRKSDEAPPSSGRVHRVASGQRLESIARRYGVTVDALCEANGIHRRSIIRPGQQLIIPDPRAQASSKGRGTSYRAYFRAPKRKGHVELIGHTQRFRGSVYDAKGRMLPAAERGVAQVLGATGSRPSPDKRLIRLLVQISDRFGGRPLRIVSGYRTTSYFEDSRHKVSRAVDFSIPGVPNEALRDYLRTLPNVGVGYYPNSSFVHLDVRDHTAYWVDYSGPGEAPRRTAVARRGADEVHEVHGHEPPASAEPGASSPSTELAAPSSATAPASETTPTAPEATQARDQVQTAHVSKSLEGNTIPVVLPKARAVSPQTR